MTKNKIILILLFISLSFALIYFQKTKPSNKEVHYHAGFLVYVEGKLQDFSGDIYMSPNVCLKPDVRLSSEEEQKEKAHLHDGVGDVVHVHRKGAVWRDLFRNINFPLPENKTIQGYQNNRPVDNILTQQIKPYTSVTIVIGNDKNINLQKYVSLSHIKEIEKRSESCGSYLRDIKIHL